VLQVLHVVHATADEDVRIPRDRENLAHFGDLRDGGNDLIDVGVAGFSLSCSQKPGKSHSSVRIHHASSWCCSVQRSGRSSSAATGRGLVSRLGEREDVGVNDVSAKTQLSALGALLRAQRVAAELSLRELAELTNVSNAYLSELERGLHEPSLRVLRAIASALGMPLGSMLASAGVLGDGEADRPAGLRETEAAILRDPDLSEPQRTALLSVYRSFVRTRPTTTL